MSGPTLTLLLAAVLLAPTASLSARESVAPRSAEDTDTSIEAQIAQATQLMNAGRIQEAALAADTMVADPRMASAPVDVRVRALSIAAMTAATLRRYPQATEHAQLAIALAPDAVLPLFTLSSIEAAQGNLKPAATLLVKAIGKAGGSMPITRERIEQMQRGLINAPTERRELLQALFDHQWLSDGEEPSDLWLILAGLQHDAGDSEAVRATVARIDGPMEIIQLRSDKRFDAYIDRADPRFDPRQAAQRQMDAQRVRASLNGDHDASLARLSVAALMLGDNAQVLAVTDDAATTVAKARSVGPQLEGVPPLLTLRARAQRNLGQPEAAVDTLRTVVHMTDGTPRAPQDQLNLGLLLLALGRYEEADAAVASAGTLSGYGTAQRSYIRFVAAQHRGDKAEAAAAARGVVEQGPAAASLLYELPLAAGRMNEATAMLIVQLESLKLRSSALLVLQEMRRAPTLPAEATMQARWRELVARPDVQAALAKVGRVERYDLFGNDTSR